MAEKNVKVEVNEKKFKIISVSEITTKDGKKFNAFKTLTKDGKKMDCRFVRTCTNIPKEPCVIVVASENANVDNTRQYPILWVKDIIRIEPFEKTSNLDEYFD